jgi:4-hydroxybenzoate polyprenyltransferase
MNTFAILFEVMDKEPSPFEVWRLFLLIGAGGFLLTRYRRWLLAAVLPVSLIIAWVYLSGLRDPFVGQGIVSEAGQSYVTQSYIAMALALILPCLGLISLKRRLPWSKIALR